VEVDAFLADSVVAAEGKLFAQGAGWNIINAPSMPFRMPRIGFGAIVRVPYGSTNQMHSFTIQMVDSDENPIPIGDAPPGTDLPDNKVRQLTGQFNIGRPPQLPMGDEQIVPIAVNFDGLSFDQPNQFSLVFSIDGTEMRRLPIRVRLIEALAIQSVA
jgi:hypothetical protein